MNVEYQQFVAWLEDRAPDNLWDTLHRFYLSSLDRYLLIEEQIQGMPRHRLRQEIKRLCQECFKKTVQEWEEIRDRMPAQHTLHLTVGGS